MQDVPLAKPRSMRRSAQLALASRWAGTLGRVLFGVAAPLVCFGVLLHASRETWMWPLALFVLTCVAAYVACWVRAPRQDAFDALLRGAMFAATIFAAPWALYFGCVAVGFLLFVLPEEWRDDGRLTGEHVLVLLAAASPVSWIAYIRCILTRWPRGDRAGVSDAGTTGALLVGLIGPALGCLVLKAWIDVRADALERQIVSNALAAEVEELHAWRWIAPSHSWSDLERAHRESADAHERERLDRAHEALTGQRVPEPDMFD